MLKHDLAGAQALDTGQLDIVAGQLIHHVAAGPQGIACNGCQRKAGDGQHAGSTHIAGGIQRGESQVLGTKDQHQRIRHQRRDRVDEHGVGRADPVEYLVLECRLQDAHQHTDHQRDGGCREAQTHRDTKLFTNDLDHRGTVLDAAGSAEIQMQQVVIELDQLGGDGIGQASCFQSGGLLLIGKLHELFLSEVVVRRQAAHHQENCCCDQKDCDKRLEQPLNRVF